MKHRREELAVFGLSFVDLLACSFGAAAVLLCATAQESQEASLVLRGELAARADAERQRDEAFAARAQAEAERDEARQARAAAEGERDRAQAGQQQAEAERDAAGASRRAAEAEAAQAAEERERAAEERDRAAEERDQARSRAAAAEAERDAARAAIAAAVGLRGTRRRVVFVFDTSASLGASDLPASADPAAREADRQRKLARFAEYLALLQTWVRELDCEQFNVIAFSDQPRTWRPGELVPATSEAREEAAAAIAAWTPAGSTNTHGALEAAFALGAADTLVLFSDGQPNDRENQPIPRSGESAADARARSQAAIRWILDDLAAWNLDAEGRPRVVINCVAMGDYLDADYGRFLQELARRHGGEFLGR